LDCVVTAAVDVDFQLMWRRGADNVALATWSKHFEPLASGYTAQAYEVDKNGAGIDFVAADQLVFRYAARNTTKVEAWIPNGDGDKAHGRIPNITLPH
jgi:hypothetical protein